ncbi:MAG: KH domain-containing protein [Bacilli bacterium]|nr:KH domain-containing protein [Bacilli bacterium]
MGVVNYEVLLSELIKPLVSNPNEVAISIVEESDKYIKLKVSVDPEDLGRIIGRKGRIANAIRTIAHAAAIRDNMRIDIDLASEEVEEQN